MVGKLNERKKIYNLMYNMYLYLYYYYYYLKMSKTSATTFSLKRHPKDNHDTASTLPDDGKSITTESTPLANEKPIIMKSSLTDMFEEAKRTLLSSHTSPQQQQQPISISGGDDAGGAFASALPVDIAEHNTAPETRKGLTQMEDRLFFASKDILHRFIVRISGIISEPIDTMYNADPETLFRHAQIIEKKRKKYSFSLHSIDEHMITNEIADMESKLRGLQDFILHEPNQFALKDKYGLLSMYTANASILLNLIDHKDTVLRTLNSSEELLKVNTNMLQLVPNVFSLITSVSKSGNAAAIPMTTQQYRKIIQDALIALENPSYVQFVKKVQEYHLLFKEYEAMVEKKKTIEKTTRTETQNLNIEGSTTLLPSIISQTPMQYANAVLNAHVISGMQAGYEMMQNQIRKLQGTIQLFTQDELLQHETLWTHYANITGYRMRYEKFSAPNAMYGMTANKKNDTLLLSAVLSFRKELVNMVNNNTASSYGGFHLFNNDNMNRLMNESSTRYYNATDAEHMARYRNVMQPSKAFYKMYPHC
jgi:hypothetical protein